MANNDLKNSSDEELMEIYKVGDSIAFEILFARHSGRIQAYLARKVFSQREAQDLLQEVFFKLHRSRHLYDSALPFSPWLFSIARSIWLDHVKKRKIEKDYELERITALTPSALPTPIVELTNGNEFLERLPENQKEAVGMRVFDEATFEEIATKLSTSPENARQLVSRGLKKLKAVLGKRKD